MSNLKSFLKVNKLKKENTTYPATKSLKDETGNPLLWTIQPITTRQNDILRDECTIEVQVKGKSNLFRPKIDTSKFIAKLICAAVVEPSLHDKELQDSYGVMTPEDLLKEIIDDPGEYNDLAAFVQQFNGFTETMEDKVEEAKN